MGVLSAKVPTDQARLGTAAAQTEHLTVVAVDSVPVTPAAADSESTPAGTASCQDQLQAHAVVIRQLGRRVIVDIIEIGRRLGECRRICGHGNWLSWLKREFGWTEQTALNFIRVHELSESKNFLDLSLPVSGLYLLAAPSTPEAARDEIIERAAAGEPISVAKAKDIVATAKGRQQPAHKPRRGASNAAPRNEKASINNESGAANAAVSALAAKVTKPDPRNDIGPTSASETGRLRARVAELENEKRRLEIENLALKSEVEELREKLATKTGGNMSFAEFDAAIKKWERTVETQRGIIARLESENAKLRAGAPPLDPSDPGPMPVCLRREPAP